jgi:hypothetical protein
MGVAGASAQEPTGEFGFGLKAGVSPYDLGNTGTAVVVGPIGYGVLGDTFCWKWICRSSTGCTR